VNNRRRDAIHRVLVIMSARGRGRDESRPYDDCPIICNVGDVMSSYAPNRPRPILVIPPSPHLKARGAPRRYKGPHLFTFLLLLLALLALVRFLLVLNTPSSSSSNTAGPQTPIDCSGLLRSDDYTKSVGLQAGEQLAALAPVSDLDGGSPAVLAQVMHSDAQHTLDVYLLGCSFQQNQPGLTTLFAQRGLVDGTVEISQAHTLITGTLDTSLSPDASALLLPSQQYIYREYAWQGDAFRQVIFPGFYPVTSRAEAEALQQQADRGQTLTWSDPLTTAEAMAKDILQWPASNDPQNVLLSNDGTTAQVRLAQQAPPLVVYVTLARLVQQDSKGLWFVVAAHTQGITLGLDGQDRTALPQHTSGATPDSIATQPAPAAQQPLAQSPMTLQGTGALADGQTSVTLFDHTLSPIASASNVSLQANTDGTYSGTLPYTTSPGQEGLLLVLSLPLAANDAVEQGQILLVPVLLF
jgi:hypothetical protein